jgi:glycosyltransferase involved in cell wall biosynthesis
MFGEEEDRYAQELRDLARALGIEERVEFRGFRSDVYVELEAMDVLVHASISPEPFGQVVLEGMSAGLAVVATRQGGPGEIVTDGRDGLLYDSGDADALAAILRRLADDATLRERLGAAAVETARAFAPGEISRQVTDIYRSALGMPRVSEQP